MRLFFGLLSMCFFQCFGFGQVSSIYFIEDVKKNVNSTNKFGSTLVELKDGKIKYLYSFNTRLQYSELIKIGDKVIIQTNELNYLYSYQLSKNKITKRKNINGKFNCINILKSDTKRDSLFLLGVFKENYRDDNVNSIDTMYVYEVDVSKRTKCLIGKYIASQFISGKKANINFFVTYDVSTSENGKICESLKMVDVNKDKVFTIDTIFYGYNDSEEKLDITFNPVNIQFTNDSSLIYTYYKYKGTKLDGLNIILSYNLKTKQHKIINSIKDKFPFEGFYFDLLKGLIYVNNEEEIYSIDISTANKVSYYKMDRKKSYKLKYLVVEP